MNVFRPEGVSAHRTVWVLKNQRTADEKLGRGSLSTKRQKTQEMNSDLWSQFKHFHSILTASEQESKPVSAEFIVSLGGLQIFCKFDSKMP